jgi:hypothetical protein
MFRLVARSRRLRARNRSRRDDGTLNASYNAGMSWRRVGVLGAGALATVLASPMCPRAAAADAPNPLEHRVRELERQNAELQKRLERLERLEQALPAERVAQTTAPPPPAAAPAEEPSPETIGLGLHATYGPVRAAFQVFGDAGVGYAEPAPEDVHTSFVVGSLDAFVTANIGDRFQALTELVFEGDSTDNEFGLDLERLWGSWTVDDWLYLKLGREHSPTSHWNRRYHHGRWLWTSATQPFLARFEDDGGILPVHQVGIEAGGTFNGDVGRLQYVGVVSNGRGRTPEEITNFADRNDSKAYDFGLGFSPVRFMDWTVGAGFHADEIPGGGSRRRDMREFITNAFLEKLAGPLELIGEYAFIHHHDRDSGRDFDHHGGYLQGGYRLGDFTPFTRFDVNAMAAGDPFFAPEGNDLDRWEQMLGIRYDLTEFAAVKLEGGIGKREEPGRVGRELTQRLDLQLAWVF